MKGQPPQSPKGEVGSIFRFWIFQTYGFFELQNAQTPFTFWGKGWGRGPPQSPKGEAGTIFRFWIFQTYDFFELQNAQTPFTFWGKGWGRGLLFIGNCLHLRYFCTHEQS